MVQLQVLHHPTRVTDARVRPVPQMEVSDSFSLFARAYGSGRTRQQVATGFNRAGRIHRVQHPPGISDKSSADRRSRRAR